MTLIETPITLKSHVSLTSHKWNILRDLWTFNHPSCNDDSSGVSFIQDNSGWVISERIDGHLAFQMHRDVVTLQRSTDLDLFGLVGLSLLNVNDTTVYITEGVSDFISAKLCLPNKNVLGVLNLGGSSVAKKILISLFTNVVIISDRDSTGLSNASHWRRIFSRFSIKSSIWFTSDPAFKDFTDEFLYNLRFSSTIQF